VLLRPRGPVVVLIIIKIMAAATDEFERVYTPPVVD